jgi:SAM-dependent methyltransferase
LLKLNPDKVLDVATGIGEPSITAAKVVGTAGHVLATDISRQMLAIAKERATLLKLQDIIEFKESDAENLDLANSSLDAALCRWGLMLFPNLDYVVEKIYSSLVSGGRFAVAVWADTTKVPIISLATRVIGSQVQMSGPPPGVPNPFSLADTNKLENSLAGAGFRDIHIDTVIVTFESGKTIVVTVKQLVLLHVLRCLKRLKKEKRMSGEKWQKKQREIMELLTD